MFILFYNKYMDDITNNDDKTIRDSAEIGWDLKKFTEKYTKAFMEDIEILNIKKAKVYPKATDNVKGMIELTKNLI